MDTIEIKELLITTTVGVHAWEKQIEQKLIMDVVLVADCAAACESDAIENAIDYTEVAKFITSACQAKHFNLIEALGEHLTSKLLEAFAIQSVEISITKPAAISNAKGVSVTLLRSKAA